MEMGWVKIYSKTFPTSRHAFRTRSRSRSLGYVKLSCLIVPPNNELTHQSSSNNIEIVRVEFFV